MGSSEFISLTNSIIILNSIKTSHSDILFNNWLPLLIQRTENKVKVYSILNLFCKRFMYIVLISDNWTKP